MYIVFISTKWIWYWFRCLAIRFMYERMALKWVLEHQFIFLKALLFVMMDLTKEVWEPAKNFSNIIKSFHDVKKLMFMYSRLNDSRAVLYWSQTGYKISGYGDSFVSLKFEIGKGINSIFIIRTSKTVFFNYNWIFSLWEGDMEFVLFFCMVHVYDCL